MKLASATRGLWRWSAPRAGRRKLSAAAASETGRGGLKRFYKEARVGRVVSSEGPTTWQVQLDGRPLLSPKKFQLDFPSEELATLVALEWQSMGARIEPTLMPVTTSVNTVVDQLPAKRELYVEELLKYLKTDTICIRVPEEEAELAELQRDTWDPIVGWFNNTFDCSLGVTDAIGLPRHGEGTVESIREHLNMLSDWELQATYMVTSVCKSLSIGLATVYGFLDAEGAIQAARLEEEYQIGLWGMVEGGHDVDRAHINVQVASSRVLLRSIANSPADVNGV